MSTSSPPASVTPTYIPTGRFATESDDNHTGPIWISTLLCLVYSTLIIIIRAHLRWNVYSLDDYVILFATILQTGEVIALIVALQHGLGQSYLLLTAEQIRNSNIAIFVAMILFIVSMCVAKLSVLLLMMRLFNLSGPRSNPDTRTKALWAVCVTAMAVAVLWCIGSIVGLSVDCSIPNLTSENTLDACPKQALRWDVIGSIDIFTEVVLVILSVVIVAPVRLKLSLKIPVVFAFSFRLPCAILSSLHIYYIHKYTASISTNPFIFSSPSSPAPNPGQTLVPVLVLMQIQLCWSMISATIPNLKSFVKSFNSSTNTFGLGVSLDYISKQGLSTSRSRTLVTNSSSTQKGTEHELTAIRSRTSLKPHRASSTASTLLTRTISLSGVKIPRRPSRKDVDLEGIGIHAGIPAVPGFGAVDKYVTRVERHSNAVLNHAAVAGLADYMGASSSSTTGGGGAGSLSPVVSEPAQHHIDVHELGGSAISIGECSMDSREHIIRKETQFEVRYEMI